MRLLKIWQKWRATQSHAPAALNINKNGILYYKKCPGRGRGGDQETEETRECVHSEPSGFLGRG